MYVDLPHKHRTIRVVRIAPRISCNDQQQNCLHGVRLRKVMAKSQHKNGLLHTGKARLWHSCFMLGHDYWVHTGQGLLTTKLEHQHGKALMEMGSPANFLSGATALVSLIEVLHCFYHRFVFLCSRLMQIS